MVRIMAREKKSKRKKPDKETQRRWNQSRKALKLSPHAYLMLLKVLRLMYEMQIDVVPSPSTAVEFMYSIMEAYHDKRRLDVMNWKPKTKYYRRNYKPSDHNLEPKYIIKAMSGGLEYVNQKITAIKEEIEDAIARREQAARQARAVNSRKRREAAARKR